MDTAHIEMQLAHAPKNDVEAAYNKAFYLPQRRVMMQGWADFLDQTRESGKDTRRLSTRGGTKQQTVTQGRALQPTV